MVEQDLEDQTVRNEEERNTERWDENAGAHVRRSFETEAYQAVPERIEEPDDVEDPRSGNSSGQICSNQECSNERESRGNQITDRGSHRKRFGDRRLYDDARDEEPERNRSHEVHEQKRRKCGP